MSKVEEALRREDQLLHDFIESDKEMYKYLAVETNGWQTTDAKRTREKIRLRIQDTSLQRQTLSQVMRKAGKELPASYPKEES